jgi:hypothetical protein
MLGILANYANNPIPFNNLAFIADGLHARSDFHRFNSNFSRVSGDFNRTAPQSGDDNSNFSRVSGDFNRMAPQSGDDSY